MPLVSGFVRLHGASARRQVLAWAVQARALRSYACCPTLRQCVPAAAHAPRRTSSGLTRYEDAQCG
eukprot:6209232-Pleurochrysis_carterae.AAC.1